MKQLVVLVLITTLLLGGWGWLEGIGWADKGLDLLRASAAGNISRVRELIKAGADVNAKTKDGETVLMWASFSGHVDTARELIKAGADLNAKQKDGETVLMMAAGEGHTDTTKELIKAGADVNAKTKDGDRKSVV